MAAVARSRARPRARVGPMLPTVLRVIGLTAVFPVLALTYAAAIWIFKLPARRSAAPVAMTRVVLG